MVVISVAHHMGFVEKVYDVCGDIARCPMCSCMWGTLVVLLLTGCQPLVAIALSFFVSYLSNWLGLVLRQLAQMYDKLWQKLNDRTQER